jgi:cell division protein FtsQ
MRWLKRNNERASRKKPAPSWVRPAARFGVWAGIAAAAIGAPYAAIQSGLAGQALAAVWRPMVAASAGMGMTVKQVLADGRVETSQADILAAVGVRGGEAILAIDPDAARARVEALPWVRSAAVERRLPDTIRVRIVERRAVAWWQKDGKMVLIDRTGVPIRVTPTGKYQGLIVLVGDDAPTHAAALLDMLAKEPALAARARAAVRVGARRWNVRLDDAIDVRLPEDGAEAAWIKLAELDRKNRILSRDIEAVDLRLPDRLIVQTKGGGAPGGGARPTSASGRDT